MLVVVVAGLDVALPLGCVGEVHRMVEVAELPGAPSAVAGVVELRDEVVPVVDLRSRLGLLAAEPSLEHRLVSVRHGGDLLLLWVDAVRGLRRLDPGDVEDLDGVLAATPHLSGVARTPDGLLFVQDPERFLSSRERVALQASIVDHLRAS